MEALQKKRLHISYKKTSDYKVVPAAGVFGGPTGQGDILINFYVEYRVLPESVEVEINPDGSAEETPKVAKDAFIRELNTGILMRADIAKSVGEWLIKQANALIGPQPTLNS